MPVESYRCRRGPPAATASAVSPPGKPLSWLPNQQCSHLREGHLRVFEETETLAPPPPRTMPIPVLTVKKLSPNEISVKSAATVKTSGGILFDSHYAF